MRAAEGRRAPKWGDFCGDPVDRVVADVDEAKRTFRTVRIGVEGCPVVLGGEQGMWFRAVAAPIEDGWVETEQESSDI